MDVRGLAVRDAIAANVLDFPVHGYRRVTKLLQRDGWVVNHTRVTRLMRQESLLSRGQRLVVVTTDAAHRFTHCSNLVRDLGG